jgi:hypothetical protein
MSETENKPPERRIDVDDGKYTFILKPGEYRVHVLRHGEPWLVVEQGSKAIWSLVAELIDATALVEVVRAWVGVGTSAAHHAALAAPALVEALRKYQAERGEATQGDAAQAGGWRTDAAPHGMRCLVTATNLDSGYRPIVHVAVFDAGHERWFLARGDNCEEGQLYGVIAWMPAPTPAAAQNGAA